LSDAAASRSPKTKSLTVDTAPVPPVAQDLGEQVPVLARPLAVDRVVGGHDARDALGRHALEVRQVYLVQRSLLDGHVDPEPGVLHRVERIVLGAGHNVPLRPAGQGRAKRAQVQRVVSVGLLHPAPGGVTWQVDARPAEEVPALGPDLGADGLADPLLQRRIPGGALGHRHGKRGPFARDAAARAVHEADPGDAQAGHLAVDVWPRAVPRRAHGRQPGPEPDVTVQQAEPLGLGELLVQAPGLLDGVGAGPHRRHRGAEGRPGAHGGVIAHRVTRPRPPP
jgi:hypothetical protein